MKKRDIHIRSRSGRISFTLERRLIRTMLILSALTCILVLASLSLGSMLISPLAVLRTLIGTEDQYAFIIQTLRLPRILVALFAGAALGVAGAILQGVVRNPLASPDIIGITGGAAVAAVAFLVYLNHALSVKLLPLFAISGAFAMAILIYLLTWKKDASAIRLVLIGIGLQMGMQALTTMLIVFSPVHSAMQAYIWLTGSVYGASWEQATLLMPWVVVFLCLALLSSRQLNIQELGDQVATGLGTQVSFQRFYLLFLSVALAGSAVAVVGTVSFVGLIAPHISRKLIGRLHGSLIPVSALIGGLIVLGADLVARTAFQPYDIPAGVFVSGIGAPFFIYLLIKNRRM
jgi:iron complex transport system permease protein